MANYRIIKEEKLEDLETTVDDCVFDGWIPAGGISVIQEKETMYSTFGCNPRDIIVTFYVQALYKPAE